MRASLIIYVILNIRSRYLLTTNALSVNINFTLKDTVYIGPRVNTFALITISSISSALKDIKLVSSRSGKLRNVNKFRACLVQPILRRFLWQISVF